MDQKITLLTITHIKIALIVYIKHINSIRKKSIYLLLTILLRTICKDMLKTKLYLIRFKNLILYFNKKHT